MSFPRKRESKIHGSPIRSGMTIIINMICKNRYLKGFSLIEVMVFVTVLSLFFISAVSVTTFILRNMLVQEHKIIATRYAEEAIEWLKQEKEDDWSVFTSHDTGSGTTYCLNTLDFNTTSDCGTNYVLGPPNIFKRVLIITNSGSPVVDNVAVNLTVSWLENGSEQKVIIKSVSNLWE